MIEMFFQKFTILAFGLSLLNLLAVRNKISPAAKIYLASLSGLFLVWWLLQVAGGYSTFFFILLSPDEHPLVALFWLVFFLTLWVQAFWIIWRNGDDRLKNSRTIKLFYGVAGVFIPLLVILGYISGFFARAIADLGQLISP